MKAIWLIFMIMVIFFSGCSLMPYPNSNINVNDGVLRNESGDSIIENNSAKVSIYDPSNNNVMGINEEGRANFVQHAHPSQGTVHFHVEDLTAGTYRYVIIDVSNTTVWPHFYDEWIHSEWFQLQVDSDVNGDYTINLCFLENVTNESSSVYTFKHIDGSKQTGNQVEMFDNPYPNGWKLFSDGLLGHSIFDDIAYNNITLLPSPINATSGNIYPNNGDMVLEVVVNAGTINVAFDIGYHTHLFGQTDI